VAVSQPAVAPQPLAQADQAAQIQMVEQPTALVSKRSLRPDPGSASEIMDFTVEEEVGMDK